ncbi:MAG: hypothetical protein ACRECJ_08905 [Limisphaerales bacterium]
MRYLILLGAAVLMLAVIGCSSNTGSGITGPTSAGSLSASGPTSGGSITPPDIPVPAGALAFYGTVSNLSGGSFTLTAPDGRNVNVTTDENTQVLALGSFAAVDASALADDQVVSLWGHIEGRPSGPPGEGTAIDAVLIVINARQVNGLIVVD